MIKKIYDLAISRTLKNTSVLFLGNAISSILGIIFTIIAARWLGPERWGLVAALGNVIPIIVALADFGLGASIFQFTAGKWGTKENNIARNSYISAFTLRLLSALIITILFVLFGNSLSKIIYGISNATLVIATALGFLGASLLDFTIFTIQSQQKWVIASLYTGLTNVFRVSILILLYMTGNLSLSNALYVFAGSNLIIFVLSVSSLPFGLDFSSSLKYIKQFARFSAWMSGNKIVSTISSRIDIPLILYISGSAEAGIYGAASRLAMGVPLVLGSFATVLAARFASIDNKSELVRFFKRSIALSGLICAFIVVGVMITPFVTQLFGDQYYRSTQILQLLFMTTIPFALATPAVNILIYRFKKPSIITYLSVLQLLIIVGVNYMFLSSIKIYAPILAIGLSNITTMLITYYFAIKCLKNYV